MLNTASVNAVNGSQFSQRLVKPLYDSYCFSNIPQTIEFLLTGEGQSGLPLDVLGNLPRKYDKVILFFVDAFGWHFFHGFSLGHVGRRCLDLARSLVTYLSLSGSNARRH